MAMLVHIRSGISVGGHTAMPQVARNSIMTGSSKMTRWCNMASAFVWHHGAFICRVVTPSVSEVRRVGLYHRVGDADGACRY